MIILYFLDVNIMFYLIFYRGNNTLKSSKLQGYDCQKLPIWLRGNMLPKLLNKNKLNWY